MGTKLLPANKSNAVVMAAKADLQAALGEWYWRKQRVQAPNTLRAWISDWAVWYAWCRDKGVQTRPTTPKTLAQFIENIGSLRDIRKRVSERDPKTQEIIHRDILVLRKMSTLRRYVATINKVHHALDLPRPGKTEIVQDALRAQARDRAELTPVHDAETYTVRQAEGANWPDLRKMLELIPFDPDTELPETLDGARDAALLTTAYYTGLRRSELSALTLRDLKHDKHGWRVHRRRAKNDPEGKGKDYFIPEWVAELIQHWVRQVKIDHGPLFRGFYKGNKKVRNGHLHPDSIYDIVKKHADSIGLKVEKFSGHSFRVGVIEDLVDDNASTAGIAQALGYKTEKMVLRYSANQRHPRVIRRLAEKHAKPTRGS